MDHLDEKAILDRIVASIVAHQGVKRIILFGSRAEKSARSDSDFDICVITEQGAAGEQAYIEMMSSILSSKYSVDLEVCDETEFEQKTREGWAIFKAIKEKGKELYAA